jgi:uncharacterized protein (TIGR04255 family)
MLRGWTTPLFGLYWTLIRSEYPFSLTAPPLPSIHPGPLEFVDPNLIRCRFVDKSDNNLIQLQPNWFLRNWRKVKGDEVYPRYSTLRASLEEEWTRFVHFLTECKIEQPQQVYCEATYLNVIEPPDESRGVADLPQIVSLFSEQKSGALLSNLNTINLVTEYVSQVMEGSLRITLNPAIRARDNKTVIQLNLTVRGKPKSQSTNDILVWMDSARDWIVRSFTEFTTPKMHKIWRRTT